MTTMVMPALLSMALLLLVPGILSGKKNTYPLGLLVMNTQTSTPNKTYITEGVQRGILLGAMRKLNDSNKNFNFTYIDNLDYGPYLVSVNGVAGSPTSKTYWELLVKKASGEIIRPDVGIGCYITEPNEQIILKFTKFKQCESSE
ncbi:transcobalamin-1-like [Polymixia lowei]